MQRPVIKLFQQLLRIFDTYDKFFFVPLPYRQLVYIGMKTRLLFIFSLFSYTLYLSAVEPQVSHDLFAQELLNKELSATADTIIDFIPVNSLNSLELITKRPNHTPDTLFSDIIYGDTITRYVPRKSDSEFAIRNILSWDGKKKSPERPDGLIRLDPVFYAANPFFKELIFTGIKIEPFEWNKWEDGSFLFYGEKLPTLDNPMELIEFAHPETTLRELREDAIDHITHNAPHLYTATIDQLPVFNFRKDEIIETRPLEGLELETGLVPVTTLDRTIIRKKELSPWNYRLHGLLQLSQTGVSENWHKGGYSNASVLWEIKGKLNYDNKKKIKWDNSLEWRTGINSLPPVDEGETRLKDYLINEDIFRLMSQFGLKATGNFYYSASFKTETQFFENYKDDKFAEMKAKAFAPLTITMGVGMDYKYKDFLSIVVSPLSFKYIYINDTYVNDTISVNPKLYGIDEGKNEKKELGSEVTIQLKSYKPISNLKLDSRFNFYTNYEGVIIDWEIIAEFSFNRFLSTRLMINPRYDTIQEYPEGKSAKIQIKEILTVGFSYRFL